MRVTTSTPFVLASLAFLAVQPLAAQVCDGRVGMGPGSSLSANVGGGVYFPDVGREYQVGAAVGAARLYGIGEFGYADTDSEFGSLKSVGVRVGYDLAPATSGFSFCPSVEGTFGWGLEVGASSVTSRALGGGLGAGYEVDLAPRWSLVPSAQLMWVRVSMRSDGVSVEEDTLGRLVLGAGVRADSRWQVTPVVRVPISSEGDEATFGVSASISVRR